MEADREIQPHTDSGGILTVSGISEDNREGAIRIRDILNVEQDHIDPAVEVRTSKVIFYTECRVSVVNLAAVLSGGEERAGAGRRIHLAAGVQRVVDGFVLVKRGNTVRNLPIMRSLLAQPAVDIVFEVPQDLGAFAIGDRVGQNRVGGNIGNGRDHAGLGGILGRADREAVERCGGRIIQRYSEASAVVVNVRFADFSFNGDFRFSGLVRSRIGENGLRNAQLEGGRIRNVNGAGAHHGFAGENLDIHVSQRAVGNERAVGNRAERGVRQGPGRAFRERHFVAVGIHCLCVESEGSAGGKVIIVALDLNVVQNARRANVGNDEHAVDSGTLRTVAGNRAHLPGALTGTFGDEGRGAAAVAVDSPLASEGEHALAQLVVIEADGVVSAAAVVHHEHQRTVFLDADQRAGSGGRRALFRGGNKSTILDDKAEVNGHRLPERTGRKIGVELGGCLNHTGDVSFGILIDAQICLSVLTPHCQVLSVVNKNRGVIRVIAERRVHTGNHVITEIILIILRRVGQQRRYLIVDVGKISVDSVIAGNDRNIGIGRINLNNVQNLSSVVCAVVQNHFGFISSTGHQRVILLGDDVVVTVCAEGCAVIDYVVFFPAFDGRKGCRRKQAERHHKAEQHSNDPFELLVHVTNPFQKRCI